MKLQPQPNRASCFITSVACIINRDVYTLMDMLGHDGTDTIMCNGVFILRGFHYEEIVRLLLKLGYLMIPFHSRIDLFNFKTMDTGLPPYTEKFSDLEEIMINRDGVISNTDTHACAWHDNVVYDPGKDQQYSLDVFKEYYGDIYCFYNIVKKT